MEPESQPAQMVTSVVVYAAKSTEDTHGSIPTQLADCRELAQRNGWEIAGEFNDEAFSAYHGNRGPGFARAKALAVKIAREHNGCVLVAQDADRFARGAGDAPGAADHLGELFFVLRRQGVKLWSVRSGELDLLRATLEGERATDESARKSQAVRAGLKRRAERGKPVGPVPIGYKAETTIVDGDPVTKRIIDPDTKEIPETIFSVVEAGGSMGDAARRLNELGHTGRRGGRFSARTVRDIVHNSAYSGEKGYPVLIEPERQQRVLASLRRMDPAAVQRRQGGRPPRADERYFLRGLAFCRHCGGSLWTRELAAGRTYLCRNVRLATGTCSAAGIPAELIESHVLDHVEAFVGSAERWLAERQDEHRRVLAAHKDAVKRIRKGLDELDRQRGLHMAAYREQVAEGRSTAPLALEAVEQIDAERVDQELRLGDAEAVAAEHNADEDAAHTTALVSSFRERMAEADSAPALNAALAGSLAGLWASVDDGRLRAEFELADPPEFDPKQVLYLLSHAHAVDERGKRVVLPDRVDARGRPSYGT